MPEDLKLERITEEDLGNMYLMYEQALIVRSSRGILFFRINEESGQWE
jgi:hypothetical protein